MALTQDDVSYLRQVVAECTGNVISGNQGYLFESKLKPLADKLGYDSVEHLVFEFRNDDCKITNECIAEAMTINETFFFRDGHPFDTLRTEIIPELIHARRKQRKLTIWCAACSCGQEPYSVAITLREHFPELRRWEIKILATDICDDALAKAKSGVFSQFEVNRGLPTKLLTRYFTRSGTKWTVRNDLRSMLDVAKINLAKPWAALPNCDIVFLRNVLIYFDLPTKKSILGRVRSSMADDSYLLLGNGETLISLQAPFERKAIGKTVAYVPTPREAHRLPSSETKSDSRQSQAHEEIGSFVPN